MKSNKAKDLQSCKKFKIITFADVHGNFLALKKLRKKPAYKTANLRIFLGDAICLGPKSKQCIKAIFADKCLYLLGNHELNFINNITFTKGSSVGKSERLKIFKELGEETKQQLSKFKLQHYISYGGKTLAFMHFATNPNGTFKQLAPIGQKVTKKDIIKKFSDVKADYVFYGHEHNFNIVKDNNKIIYGLGACGAHHTCRYATITLKNNKIKIKIKKFKYSLKKYIKEINQQKNPESQKYINGLKTEKKFYKARIEK